ncbi:MAG TPA: HAD family hydrolase [Rectinemataceae bacterium]|nr:HAD family hydrolase [Rectinemataceae bacterium]
MSDMTNAEARGLVALFRGLSPRDPSPLRAEIPAELVGLLSAPLPRRPGAILFDLYGTLFASAAGGEPGIVSDGYGEAATGAPEAWAARVFLAAELRAAGDPRRPEAFAADIDRGIAAFRDRARANRAFPEIDIAEIVGKLLPGLGAEEGRRISLAHEAWRNPCAPMRGALDLIEALGRGGYRLGIVSNAQFYTPLLFEALFGKTPAALGFEAGLTAYSFELGIAKPDPEVFRRAVARLLASGMAPGEILAIGNSAANDVVPASALGLMTALFAGDARSFRPAAALSPGKEPDTILTDLEGLVALFPTV